MTRKGHSTSRLCKNFHSPHTNKEDYGKSGKVVQSLDTLLLFSLHPFQNNAFPALQPYFFSTSGSGKIPSASNLLRASSSAQVCILPPDPTSASIQSHRSQSPPLTNHKIYTREIKIELDSRSIRLESIRHNPHQQAPKKTIDPHILPPLLLVLFPRRDTPQPAGRRVVVILVVGVGGGPREVWP